MSISTEITRISGNVSDALTAIGAKGVTVPTGANSDDLATLITAIPTTSTGGNNPTLDTEWKDIYSDWVAGYYYDPDNDYAYTQIPSTETTWEVTQTYISTSCTPYSNMIPVKAGEEYRYQNMPIHFDSKNAEIPSVIIFDTNKAEIEAYTRTYQDEWTEFTIPANGVWMAVMYANSQTYHLQKKVAKTLDKEELWDSILADYRSYSATTPRTPKTLTKALICLGTDDLRPAETKNLHTLFTTNNIPYYMAAIPQNLKACVTDDPGKTNLDYMKMCVQAGGEIVCHSDGVITEQNKTDFDTMYAYFAQSKEEFEYHGFKVRGIFKAGGENAIYYPSDPLIDAWAVHYYEFGDYFRDAFPYNMNRSLLDDWADYSLLTTAIQTAVQNKSYFIGAFHYYNSNAELAMTTIKNALQGYTKGTDYDFVTPSQLFDALMPTAVPSGSGTDSDTKYSLSISGNVITLTGTDGSTPTSVTLPVYNGGVT